MKDDLISRSELLKKAVHMIKYEEEFGDVNVYAINMWDVEEAPAVDAEPVRHGRWVEWWPSDCALILTGEEMLWECSECTAKVADRENMKYCPHCGAKMDGEERA